MDKIEREEVWKMYEEALKKAHEEYENAVNPLKRKYERTEKVAFKVYKAAIERAQELIKDIKWDSDDEFTLRSY